MSSARAQHCVGPKLLQGATGRGSGCGRARCCPAATSLCPHKRAGVADFSCTQIPPPRRGREVLVPSTGVSQGLPTAAAGLPIPQKVCLAPPQQWGRGKVTSYPHLLPCLCRHGQGHSWGAVHSRAAQQGSWGEHQGCNRSLRNTQGLQSPHEGLAATPYT